eukprot:361808-Chlamydomonas_euryale.AAC.26
MYCASEVTVQRGLGAHAPPPRREASQAGRQGPVAPLVGRVSTGTSEVRHCSVESTAVLARERPRRIGVK